MKTEKEKIEQEIKDITQIETTIGEVKPEIIKKITSKAICLFGDKNLREILRICDSEKLKGYEAGKSEEQERSKRLCNKCKPYQEGIIIGKSESIKQEIKFLEDLTFYQPKDYEGKLLLKEIIERIIFLKSKIGELAKWQPKKKL